MTNRSRRVWGPQILIRAPGLTNLGDHLSPTTTVTLRMIYFTTLWNHVYSSYSHNLVEVQEFTFSTHFNHCYVSSTNDLAGLIVGVGLQPEPGSIPFLQFNSNSDNSNSNSIPNPVQNPQGNSIPIPMMAIPIQFQWWQFQFNSKSDVINSTQFRNTYTQN